MQPSTASVAYLFCYGVLGGNTHTYIRTYYVRLQGNLRLWRSSDTDNLTRAASFVRTTQDAQQQRKCMYTHIVYRNHIPIIGLFICDFDLFMFILCCVCVSESAQIIEIRSIIGI